MFWDSKNPLPNGICLHKPSNWGGTLQREAEIKPSQIWSKVQGNQQHKKVYKPRGCKFSLKRNLQRVILI